MEKGNLYFIKNEFFDDFAEEALSCNKETDGNKPHDRPCFFVFEDKFTGLYWMIPLSSRVEKYRKIYANKIKRNGKCDTIVFGNVLGHEKVFLIQNMCPISNKYVKNQYLIDGCPVRVDNRLAKELHTKATKALKLTRNGVKILFPDVLAIEQKLLAEHDDSTQHLYAENTNM